MTRYVGLACVKPPHPLKQNLFFFFFLSLGGGRTQQAIQFELVVALHTELSVLFLLTVAYFIGEEEITRQ